LPCFAIAASCSVADEASHKRAALKLMEVTNAKDMMDQRLVLFEGLLEQTIDASDLTPEEQEAANDTKKELMDWCSDILDWEKLRDQIADIYVQVFTEDELNELIRFYQSPVGQKLLEKTPEIMQKSVEIVQTILQDKLSEFQE
jgi:hypothetical protein